MEIAKMCLFLKELRKEKGLTQEQAAEQLFVTPKTLSRWETGRTIPDLETVLRLADFYEVDIKDLLSGERAPESETPQGEGAGAAGEDASLQLLADYGKKKEKRSVRRAVIILAALFLLAVGVYAVLQQIRFEKNLEGDESRIYYGYINLYSVDEERGLTLIWLNCDTYVEKIMISPDTFIFSEELQARLAAQEQQLPVRIVSIYQKKALYNATKNGGKFTYPAHSVELWEH